MLIIATVVAIAIGFAVIWVFAFAVGYIFGRRTLHVVFWLIAVTWVFSVIWLDTIFGFFEGDDFFLLPLVVIAIGFGFARFILQKNKLFPDQREQLKRIDEAYKKYGAGPYADSKTHSNSDGKEGEGL